MRRILMLLSVAAMLAAAMALSGLAQAKPIIDSKADAKCLAEAAKTVKQPGFKPADYTFHGGSADNDDFFNQGTAGPDVFCGFGGNDDFEQNVEEGDIFLGGAGDDLLGLNLGTVYGQEGNDFVNLNPGTFFGGAGDDSVSTNNGTFDGGDGVDSLILSNTGILINVEVFPSP